MMRRALLLAPGILLASASLFAQTPSTDSQTLQALLAEVRQLRQDLQTTTVAVQRAQILLYRLQIQEAVVSRATQHFDEAHAKLVETQTQTKNLQAELKRSEDFVSHTENPPAERKQTEETLPYYKWRLDAQASEEQERLAKEIDAEQQLRVEQPKLADLQSQLDRLDQELETISRQTTRPH